MRRLHLPTNPMKTLRASTSVEGLRSALGHLFRIAVSFSLLFMDNTILLVAVLLSRLRPADRRQPASKNEQLYPKTMLITGIGTSHGLALARAWKAEGHRVVGADVVDLGLPIRSGGSMSKALVAFYQVPSDHYISKVLEIIHREKIDLWIPCSPKATAIEDATARQVIESRTLCKCIAFDTELISCFVHPDSFKQFLVERDLPVLEHHQVQSRDSIHRILNRTPTKSYRLSSGGSEAAVSLPKRTLSKTYSEISEIKISKEHPWILQQQSRLGEFFADLLVVRGHVHAIKVRLADTRSPHWGASRLDEALAAAIHRLMRTLASKGGPRMTGHLSVRLLVDEEFDVSSVRHTIHIADCISGAAAFDNLLRDAPCPISGYLAAFDSAPTEPPAWKVMATLSPNKPPRLSLLDNKFVAHLLPWFLSLDTVKEAIISLEAKLVPFLFWMDPQFSYLDPVPWWWHVHVYQPLREIWMLVKQTRAAGLAGCFDD
ncbi:uncharacterized protein N7443_003675 [Penicillium atrosanguineum]|uniref:uncharacterized protein n=1 Tax=Penicillium atrosanguineum TaxID=1132637 RepID=UPI002383754A|nr:uncharacterized protein N7443_003675 [Penicillium atrosanguineum]KAJ5304015.1 hypothetical protein N7443_003675 [Penicillium atrosanguineum]